MTVLATEQTIADWVRAQRDRHVELVRGEIVDQEKGMLSLWIASRIITIITMHVQGKGMGYAAGEVPLACFDFIDRNHGRKPDVVYYRTATAGPMASWTVPMRVMPELAVEVLSPSNDAIDMDEKIDEYFRAGALLVWVVNPKLKTVRIYRPDRKSELLVANDAVSGEDVIPGFTAKVSDFFADAVPA